MTPKHVVAWLMLWLSKVSETTLSRTTWATVLR